MLDHAFAGAVRMGADWVTFFPAFFLYEVDPRPRYIPHNNDLSLTDDVYFAAHH